MSWLSSCQTPDAMYTGTADAIPPALASRAAISRRACLQASPLRTEELGLARTMPHLRAPARDVRGHGGRPPAGTRLTLGDLASSMPAGVAPSDRGARPRAHDARSTRREARLRGRYWLTTADDRLRVQVAGVSPAAA